MLLSDAFSLSLRLVVHVFLTNVSSGMCHNSVYDGVRWGGGIMAPWCKLLVLPCDISLVVVS